MSQTSHSVYWTPMLRRFLIIRLSSINSFLMTVSSLFSMTIILFACIFIMSVIAVLARHSGHLFRRLGHWAIHLEMIKTIYENSLQTDTLTNTSHTFECSCPRTNARIEVQPADVHFLIRMARSKLCIENNRHPPRTIWLV